MVRAGDLILVSVDDHVVEPPELSTGASPPGSATMPRKWSEAGTASASLEDRTVGALRAGAVDMDRIPRSIVKRAPAGAMMGEVALLGPRPSSGG